MLYSRAASLSCSVPIFPHQIFALSPNIGGMSYIQEVKKILGEKNVEQILFSAKNGDISDQKVADMAQKLGVLSSNEERPNFIFGNHRQRMGRERYRGIEAEVRDVLCDWPICCF